MGEFTARAAPNVLRLALVYALADGAHKVSGDHLEAALRLWDYIEDTARWLFSTAAAETRATEEARLVDFIANAGADGVTRTAIRADLYARNKSAKELDALLAPLIHAGRIEQTTARTAGRPKTIYRTPRPEGI